MHDSNVAAGFPTPAENHIEKSLDLNELIIRHPAATFFVRVQGSSMEDARIYTGDILVVDRALTPKNGSIVVAIIDGEFTVKYLVKEKDTYYLRAANPNYPPIQITNDSEFAVWGVVSHIIHSCV